MKKIKFYFLILPILFIAAIPTLTGKVVGVADGDTITILVGKEQHKIRLHGVDSPESHQAYGRKAKQFTSDLAFGATVTVIVRDKDRYGRTVGEVILGNGRNLNHELVRNGFAWWYKQYAAEDTSLQRLESEAQEAKICLWSDPDPVPPWEFRRNRRDGSSQADDPKGDPNGKVILNPESKIYHCPDCEYAKICKGCISATAETVREYGARSCKVCGGCL